MTQDTAPARPRRGRPPKSADPRSEIMDRAARLFAEKGYDAASVADLSAALGMSKPAIYNYFPSKQALFDAIILQTLSRLMADVAQAVDPAAPAPEQLRAYMRAHARCLETQYHAFVATLIGFSGMSQDLRQDALLLRDTHESALRGIIAKGAAEGSLRSANPDTVARAVLSMLSWMARWFRPGAGKTAEAVADEYCDLLLAGLLPPS